MRLDGRTALITGGGTGIGRAVAELFAAEGARVCITGRTQDKLDLVAGSLPPDSCAICTGDVTKVEDAIRMVATALRFTGRLDILVNNAAIDLVGSLTDIEPDVWRQVLEVNLTGPFLMMRAAVPHMVAAGGGSIINVSSLAGIRCLHERPAYCSSKAGLIMLTKQVALDYGHANVRCNVVLPGPTRTAMLEHLLAPAAQAMGTDLDDVFARMSSNSPLRRVASPKEIARVCLCMAGDDTSFVTGAEIVVDGGAQIVDGIGAAMNMPGREQSEM
jgi:meso-butanediol dehydrogenase/(S,S)-butanediol dehydrogenase/diacetyl reductase